MESLESRGLFYPVTVVDGEAVYDGAVSYPVIMRAVTESLERQERIAASESR